MANAPSPPWRLNCPWCRFFIFVNNRGQRGANQGAGVEAAELMQAHVERHDRTWTEFLEKTS